jgi:multiple sugar transport system ATP-binding protein
MASIELRRVRKRFGGHDVIHDVDLVVEDREFVAFVGPSGSGKSTLLRMIAGLEEVTEGEVLINGTPAQNLPPAKRRLAMVFQSYALYPHMSVAENLSFSLRLAGVPKKERDEKVRAVARILDIELLLERKPRQLSGGQMQRVAIGRAMVRQPQAFLLDEPLSNLDAALQAQMRLELVRLHRELKTIMIYVTHDQLEAMTMADRIVVLNGGRVEQIGSPLELYRNPSSVFVAAFIGAPKMNFLMADAKASDGESTTLLLPSGTLVKVPGGSVKLQAGAKIKVGLRPEQIELKPEGDLKGEIEAIEHLGSRAYLHARLADGTTVVAEAEGETRAHLGEQIALQPRWNACHLFDESGKVLPRANSFVPPV